MAQLRPREGVLAGRLRDLYARGEPDPVLVLLESGSLSEALATAEVLEVIAERDRDVAAEVKALRHQRAPRPRRDRRGAGRGRGLRGGAPRPPPRRRGPPRPTSSASRRGWRRLRAERSALLENVRADREDVEAEARGLERRSAALAARIRRAQGVAAAPGGSVPVGPASAAGLVWPVHGAITSGFGPRWGRMHEGLDIAGAGGTPIGAAAGGTVISAGWSGGYGNLVVVDHGNGLSTAYGHMSSIAVASGQSVAQGTVLGGMGTTGSSTGVHLHFEVRVNGSPTDPLGYL